MFLSLFQTALAALTVENLFFPNGLGFSRILRSARKPRHRVWYAVFVFVFSALSLETALLLPPQLFPAAWRAVLRPASLAVCSAVFYCLAALLLSRCLPRFYGRHGAVLAPAALNTVVLALPQAPLALSLGPAQGLAFAAGSALAFYLSSLVFTPIYRRCRSQDTPAAFRGLPAALLAVGLLSLAFFGFAP